MVMTFYTYIRPIKMFSGFILPEYIIYTHIKMLKCRAK